MEGISILICCYNGVQRLPETIRHLGLQEVSEDIKWEIILVDNNSTDGTSEVARNLFLEYASNLDWTIIKEPRAGKTYAIDRGVSDSKYDTILICDDDNWLSSNYIQLAYEYMSSNSRIGILGGSGIAVCEVAPPEWFDNFPGIYAVGRPYSQNGPIRRNEGILYGAGMVYRKSAYLQIKRSGYEFMLTDRKGSALSSGGDSEFCFLLKLLGYELWFVDKLVYKHYIPSGRLSWGYVKKMSRGYGKSWPLLRALSGYLDQKEFDSARWRKMLFAELSYLFNPKVIWAYYRAVKHRNGWIVVDYPARWHGLWDLISLGNQVSAIQKNIGKILCHNEKKMEPRLITT